MLPWVCSVIDHRRRQNVVRTSVTHSAIASCATFLFLPHFDVICDLLLNRRTATWNLFVKYITFRRKTTSQRSDFKFHVYTIIRLQILHLHSNSFKDHSNTLGERAILSSTKGICSYTFCCSYTFLFLYLLSNLK